MRKNILSTKDLTPFPISSFLRPFSILARTQKGDWLLPTVGVLPV